MVITNEETQISDIKASSLKIGDIFLHNGQEHVAIEDYIGGFALWVTSKERFIQPWEDGLYGYTSATIIRISDDDDVKLTGNLLKPAH